MTENETITKQDAYAQRENNFRFWLQKEIDTYQNIGIGIQGDEFYFGKKMIFEGKETDIVITSKKEKFIGNDIKTIFGLNYRFPLFADCIDYTWSNGSIDRWLYDEGLEDDYYSLEKCYRELKEINKSYMHYPDSRIASFLALDIMKTYFKPIFESMGRTFFLAEKESGKTRQCQIYQLTAFNPIFSSDISPASYYRVVESTGGTIIIDDFDKVESELKDKLIQHLRTGYKYGNKAIRADGNRNSKPIGYNNYTHVVINNTLGLDEITEDRCNKILLLKSNDKSITSKKMNPKSVDWQILRDKLHICTLLNWQQVKSVYDKLDVPELSERNLEKVEAILALAKCISDDVYNEVLGLILEMQEQASIKDLKDDWSFILFEYLYHKVENETKVKVKDIADDLAPSLFNQESREYEKQKRAFNNKLGKILSGVPLFKRSAMKGYVYYFIKRKDLLKYIETRGYDKYIENYSTLSTLSTLSTNPTLSTYEKVERVEEVESKPTKEVS